MNTSNVSSPTTAPQHAAARTRRTVNADRPQRSSTDARLGRVAGSSAHDRLCRSSPGTDDRGTGAARFPPEPGSAGRSGWAAGDQPESGGEDGPEATWGGERRPAAEGEGTLLDPRLQGRAGGDVGEEQGAQEVLELGAVGGPDQVGRAALVGEGQVGGCRLQAGGGEHAPRGGGPERATVP